MRQWVLKITEYADRLREDLNLVEWPPSTYEMQKNWIGRSIGAEIDFALDSVNARLRVFTKRPDTLFGANQPLCHRRIHPQGHPYKGQAAEPRCSVMRSDLPGLASQEFVDILATL